MAGLNAVRQAQITPGGRPLIGAGEIPGTSRMPGENEIRNSPLLLLDGANKGKIEVAGVASGRYPSSIGQNDEGAGMRQKMRNSDGESIQALILRTTGHNQIQNCMLLLNQ
ncbi:MAG TPA: hypothetical protein VJT08_11630 [Terriglobales bacterium]|nr:hypothetical protein [Terriglobales bacterium]